MPKYIDIEDIRETLLQKYPRGYYREDLAEAVECAPADEKLESVLEAARHLDQLVPMPWRIKEDDLSGYMCDAESYWIFGGENDEGRVTENEPVMQALIELTQALSKVLHGEVE